MNDTTFNDGFLDGFDDVETVEDSEPVETDVKEVEDTETVEETEDTAAEDIPPPSLWPPRPRNSPLRMHVK